MTLDEIKKLLVIDDKDKEKIAKCENISRELSDLLVECIAQITLDTQDQLVIYYELIRHCIGFTYGITYNGYNDQEDREEILKSFSTSICEFLETIEKDFKQEWKKRIND